MGHLRGSWGGVPGAGDGVIDLRSNGGEWWGSLPSGYGIFQVERSGASS